MIDCPICAARCQATTGGVRCTECMFVEDRALREVCESTWERAGGPALEAELEDAETAVAGSADRITAALETLRMRIYEAAAKGRPR